MSIDLIAILGLAAIAAGLYFALLRRPPVEPPKPGHGERRGVLDAHVNPATQDALRGRD